jgi:hypothetical protein
MLCLDELLEEDGASLNVANGFERLNELRILLWGLCTLAIVHNMQMKQTSMKNGWCRDMLVCVMRKLELEGLVKVREVCAGLLSSDRMMGHIIKKVIETKSETNVLTDDLQECRSMRELSFRVLNQRVRSDQLWKAARHFCCIGRLPPLISISEPHKLVANLAAFPNTAV